MAEQTEPATQNPEPKTPKATEPVDAKKAKSNKNLLIIIGIILFVLLFVVPSLIFFVGFGVLKSKFGDEAKTTKTVSGIIESASGGQVKVDSNGKEITVKGKDGTEFSSSQKLPTDWPSSVPLYSPYTVTGSYKASTDGKTGWNLATETSDSYDKAKTGLASQYSAWTKLSEYEANGTTLTSYENTAYNVIVSISQPDKTGDKVTISYTVTQQ